jgi:hypothetical protein
MKTFWLALSLYILCTSAVMSKLFVPNDVAIDETKSISLLSSKHHELYPVRSLQNSSTPTMNPSEKNMNWTDDDACEAIFDKIYQTEDERSMEPCKCQRDANSTGAGAGMFLIDCNYDYCEECSSSSSVCGYSSDKHKFFVTDLSSIFPTEQNNCVQFTAGRDDEMCWRTNADFSYDILVGDQVCTSVEYAKCGVDGSVATDSKISDSDMSFDCSNIDGLYAMNFCDYDPHTDIAFTTPDENKDPFFFFVRKFLSGSTCNNLSDNGSTTKDIDAGTSTNSSTSAASSSSSIAFSLLVAVNSVALLLTAT